MTQPRKASPAEQRRVEELLAATAEQRKEEAERERREDQPQ